MRRALLLMLSLVACTKLRVAVHGLEPLFQSTRPAPLQPLLVVRPDARLAVTWIGHATLLVQLEETMVLIDPVFTTTVGELSKRLVSPGLDPDRLPPLDAVLVSHVHYDHLSYGSLQTIETRVRRLVVPAGGLPYVPDFGFPCSDLGAFESMQIGPLRVTATPIVHPGWRWSVDRGWHEAATGYAFEAHAITVWFAGDTAYDRARFQAVRARFPKIDLALIPIGPILPTTTRKNHLDPDQALDAFADVGAARMIPIHYDTFVHSLDGEGEVLARLKQQIETRGLGARVTPLRIGEQRVLIAR